MIGNFKTIKVESPVDNIIKQIRSFITTGQLKAGDRLPSERSLAQQFNIGRSFVRDAIRKLEFYGILKTVPQSGTVVSGLGIIALEGLITDVLHIEESDFTSLVETRVYLEVKAAGLAAQRRSQDDIKMLKNTLENFETKLHSDGVAYEEDLLFHLKIAEASKNSVLKSLMLIITPDILKNYLSLKVCNPSTTEKILIEHRQILDFIIQRDATGVEKAMTNHLSDVKEYSQNLKTLL